MHSTVDCRFVLIRPTMQKRDLTFVHDPNLGAIECVLQDYFDGLFHGDVAKLERVFHHEAHYCTASGGGWVHMDMSTYFSVVASRASPRSLGEAYEYSLESIELAGPVTAMVRMRCSLLRRDFIDLLTLVCVEGRWRIISKVFHYEENTSSVAGS